MNAIIFIVAYYGICYFALSCGGGVVQARELYRNFSLGQKAAVVLTAVFGIVLTIYWMYQQKGFVYYWDFGAYWSMSIHRTDYLFSHNFLEVLTSFFASVNQDDYNCFLPSVVALPMEVFGREYSIYVLINYVIFFFPAVLVQALCAVKLTGESNLWQGRIFAIVVALGVLFPVNYNAMYYGYIDVGFLLPLSIAVYILIGFDFQETNAIKDAALGLLLIMAWICRRYVVFFIIGYVAALVVKAVALLWRKRDLVTLRNVVVHFCIIGGVSAGILLVFFNQFFFKALLTDYGDMYSAYDAPLGQKLQELAGAFGGAVLIIAVATGVLCFVKKKNRIEFISFLMLAVVEVAMFWRVQNIGTHHRMLVGIPVFMCCMLIWSCYEKETAASSESSQSVAKGIAVLCIVVMLVNFYKTMMPLSPTGTAGGLFAAKYYALQRGDREQLEELAGYLNRETEGTEQKIYVAASGVILNDSILQGLHAPESWNAVPNMLYAHHVDLRDGFPVSFLTAEFIVTTDPVEFHLASGQEVVSYLAESVQTESSYIGRHFEEIRRFELDNGVTAKVYHKISDWEQSDLERMREYYNDLYPGHEDIFGGRIP